MLTALLFSQIVMATPQEYKFSRNDSLLYVKVFKRTDTIGAAAAHNHAIEAQAWHGSATWDSELLSACSFSFSVPVQNLAVDKTKIRKVAGLKGEVSESQQIEIKGNMLSAGQLNVDKYAKITFDSTSCEGSGSDITLNGKFTLRGKTNSVNIPVKLSTEDGLSLKGTFKIKATDYGFEPYSAMFGAVANQNEMEIHFDVKATKKEVPPTPVDEPGTAVPAQSPTPSEVFPRFDFSGYQTIIEILD